MNRYLSSIFSIVFLLLLALSSVGVIYAQTCSGTYHCTRVGWDGTCNTPCNEAGCEEVPLGIPCTYNLFGNCSGTSQCGNGPYACLKNDTCCLLGSCNLSGACYVVLGSCVQSGWNGCTTCFDSCPNECRDGSSYCTYETYTGDCGGTCWGTQSCCSPVNGTWSTPVCAVSCGQTETLTCVGASCGGTCPGSSTYTCPSTDAGIPVAPVVVAPTGTVISPFIIPPTGTTTLSWNAVPLADQYVVVLVRVTDGNAIYTSPPTTNLYVDINNNLMTTGILYYWTVTGVNTTCGVESNDWSTYNYLQINSAPTLGALLIDNADNWSGVVVADGSGRNHLCETTFQSASIPRRVRFHLAVTDPDGAADIVSGSMTWNGTVYPLTISNSFTGGVNMYAQVDFTNADNDGGVYEIRITARDSVGNTVSQMMGRYWKAWNCQVPVVGSIYDSSNYAATVCASGLGFSDLYTGSLFNSLSFNSVPGGLVLPMTINSPNYSWGINYLNWGTNYLASFNNNFDIPNRTPMVLDLEVGTTTCPALGVISLNDGAVSPYSNNPNIRINFAGARNQTAWWQVEGSGVRAGVKVENNIPPTCQFDSACKAGMSIEMAGIGASNNGLVASPSNTACETPGCYWGIPNNWEASRSVINENPNYNYFYQNLLIKNGVGTSFTGTTSMGTILTNLPGGMGVALVDGDVNITTDYNVAANRFVMVVARGNINISSLVANAGGILMADGDINATGSSNNQLVISGSLYSSSGNINLTRGYSVGSANNTSPAVVVRYRPDFIFSMPAALTKVMLNWREGN